MYSFLFEINLIMLQCRAGGVEQRRKQQPREQSSQGRPFLGAPAVDLHASPSFFEGRDQLFDVSLIFLSIWCIVISSTQLGIWFSFLVGPLWHQLRVWLKKRGYSFGENYSEIFWAACKQWNSSSKKIKNNFHFY